MLGDPIWFSLAHLLIVNLQMIYLGARLAHYLHFGSREG